MEQLLCFCLYFQEYFLRVRPDARSVEFGDVTARQKLRTDLNCRSFRWYLQIIYPEQTLPDAEGRGGHPRMGFVKPAPPKRIRDGWVRKPHPLFKLSFLWVIILCVNLFVGYFWSVFVVCTPSQWTVCGRRWRCVSKTSQG